MILTLLMAGVLAAQAPPAAAPAVLAGEAIKVDLGRRQLVVRTSAPPRENIFQVDPVHTRIGASGRAVTLDSIRPGEWVIVAFEPGVPRRAVLIKAGAARPAAARR